MKRLLTTLSIITFLMSCLWAQSPQQSLSYQTIVRDGMGNIVANQAVSFRMSILQDSATGSVAYAETHNATTNEIGLVTLAIGNGTAVSGSFAGVDWPSHLHFIKVEFDISGGTSYDLMGISQLLSVPYALHAMTVEMDQDAQQLSLQGDTIFISNGNFIIIPPTPPNCDDGIQNRDETGVDCGGIYCYSCALRCADGWQNGDETGVDCGGTSCVSCATLCSDGILNGDQTGVDCGGSCIPCAALCGDGIQNGDETGVDCGGSCASSCDVFVQHKLNMGDTPKQLFDAGYPLSLLYGKTYQGGLIFYLNTATGTGLVAAPNDQSYGIGSQWNNGIYLVTGATGTAIGTGQSNTTAIITAQGPGSYAATLCDGLTIGIYSDWFLPSKDELYQMYKNLHRYGCSAAAPGGSSDLSSCGTSLGGFASLYWSSTEIDAIYAGNQFFIYGVQSNNDKVADNNRVRAVRAF